MVALCGKGCYDPGTGDYDVVVPVDLEPGTFNLYVKELSDDGPSNCASFDVSHNVSGEVQCFERRAFACWKLSTNAYLVVREGVSISNL